MIQDILNNSSEFMVQIVLGILGILGAVMVALLLRAKEYIISKIGSTNYKAAMRIATGLWYVIADNFPELTGEEKKQRMEELLKEKFPKLTQLELDAINKAVHKQINNIKDSIGLPDLSEEVEVPVIETPVEPA